MWTHLIKTNPCGHRVGEWGTGQCGEAVSGGLGLASSRWLPPWCFLYGPNLARPGQARPGNMAGQGPALASGHRVAGSKTWSSLCPLSILTHESGELWKAAQGPREPWMGRHKKQTGGTAGSG